VVGPASLTRRFRSFLDRAGLRRIRFHGLRHSTATLLLEQGVELVVIKELLGHAHIGVTATVYAHVRLRLQRQAIDILGTTLGSPENRTPRRHAPTATNRHPAPPSSADVAVNYCRQMPLKPHQSHLVGFQVFRSKSFEMRSGLINPSLGSLSGAGSPTRQHPEFDPAILATTPPRRPFREEAFGWPLDQNPLSEPSR
jgi:hypothetical protein